jgi:hypothetical protein
MEMRNVMGTNELIILFLLGTTTGFGVMLPVIVITALAGFIM